MSEPTKIVFGVLSTHERSGWHHPSITQFFADLPFQTGTAFRMVPISNFVPAAAGRNVFCKNFKDSDTDWICMIDNDMQVPPNLLDTIKDAPADAEIVVPVFYLWDQTRCKLVLCWGKDDAPVRADGDPVGKFGPGYHELSKAGTGVIFIRPALLHGMPYPYFKYVYNADQGIDGTEDIQFCYEARKAGAKIYGNANVVVGHVHAVELSSMWKWADSVYKLANSGSLDNPLAQDAGRSPVPQTDAACSAKSV